MAVTVAVWAGFALGIRGIGASSLTTMDAALIRFVTPLLLLSPWIPGALRRLRGERPTVLAGLCLGAGLPFFLVAAAGGRLSSAALVGLVIPGTVPILVTLLAYRIRGSKISRPQVAALAAILAGVALAGGKPAGAGTLVLILAGAFWAVYTMSLRVTVLDPAGTVIALCLPSALVAALSIVTGAADSHLLHGAAATGDVLVYLVTQGAGVGVVAALCYPIAIRRLGSRTAASLGALSPVVTALAAVPLFSEPLFAEPLSGLPGFALVIGGVLIFNLMPTRPEGTVSHAADQPAHHDRSALAADGRLRP